MFVPSTSPYVSLIILIYYNSIIPIYSQRFAQDKPYSPFGDELNYDYSANVQENNYAWPFKIETAISRLNQTPKWVPEWPKPGVKFGQLSAVSIDTEGNVFVFHRGQNVWDETSFEGDIYTKQDDPPISVSTIVVLNSTTGDIVDHWGQDLFYLPHGLHVDRWNNVWVTDVALHQVFKFTPTDKSNPVLTLGKRFVPGNSDHHFCKPTAVAVMETGDFFVADGYCNSRIIKYSKDGIKILAWGLSSRMSERQNPYQRRYLPPPYHLNVPHALALAEDKSLLCVADRENGRIQCFNMNNATYVTQYHSMIMGSRLFSVAYSSAFGGRLYAVNGPEIGYGTNPIRGYVIDIESGKLLSQINLDGKNLHNPHDIAVTQDGSAVYIVELRPYKVYKFQDDRIPNNISSQLVVMSDRATDETANNATKLLAPIKPTATTEETQAVYMGSWNAWLGVAGGVAGGLGAVSICLLGTAALLIRARRTGCLSTPRNRRQRWDYSTSTPDFKLRHFLERPRVSGFERVNTEESDEEATPATSMLVPQNA